MDLNSNILYEGTIRNSDKGDLIIVSPDIEELDNYILPEFSSISFRILLNSEYKLHNQKIINNKGEITGTYIAIVDKDF